MTNVDLALIITATAAVTGAVCLVLAHLHGLSRRRQLDRVRAQRNRWYTKARALDADAVEAPIAYTLIHNPYAPVFTSGWLDGDGTHVHTEFGQVVRSGFGRGRS